MILTCCRIPNIPFFYLVYRAWSHWRAIKGSQHVQFLVKNDLLSISASPILDAIYATPRLPPKPPSGAEASDPPSKETTSSDGRDLEERTLLTPEIGKKLSKALDHPEIEFEIERALWQVEQQRETKKTDTDGGGTKGQ